MGIFGCMACMEYGDPESFTALRVLELRPNPWGGRAPSFVGVLGEHYTLSPKPYGVPGLKVEGL